MLKDFVDFIRIVSYTSWKVDKYAMLIQCIAVIKLCNTGLYWELEYFWLKKISFGWKKKLDPLAKLTKEKLGLVLTHIINAVES